MKLGGSCHCGAVTFSLESETPYPFNYCYCSICRKTSGGSGSAINIMGISKFFEVNNEENTTIYQAVIDGETSPCQRHFCKTCGSHLWLFDPRWPDWIYPLAAAIDTPLPEAPARVHLMLGSKSGWVPVPSASSTNTHFDGYPEQGIQQWHENRGLVADLS